MPGARGQSLLDRGDVRRCAPVSLLHSQLWCFWRPSRLRAKDLARERTPIGAPSSIPLQRPVPERNDLWSGRRGSNSRHAAWKAAALPTELLPPGFVLDYSGYCGTASTYALSAPDEFGQRPTFDGQNVRNDRYRSRSSPAGDQPDDRRRDRLLATGWRRSRICRSGRRVPGERGSYPRDLTGRLCRRRARGRRRLGTRRRAPDVASMARAQRAGVRIKSAPGPPVSSRIRSG